MTTPSGQSCCKLFKLHTEIRSFTTTQGTSRMKKQRIPGILPGDVVDAWGVEALGVHFEGATPTMILHYK